MAENKNQLSMVDRFSNKIIEFYSDVQKGFTPNEKQKQLIAGYYIECDKALKMQKIGWNEVDMNTLALDLMNKSRLGLDMRLPNVLFPVPFKSKQTGKVTLNLITGYEGEKQKRLLFADEKPVDIRVELVYSNDKFIPQKMGQGDTYIFEIPNPFDRGNLIGGFGYIQYEDIRKNVLVIMSAKEIEKHKPAYAKEDFWGKWKEKMYYKTIMKELCKYISLDANKVQEYNELCEYEENREVDFAQEEAQEEISNNANTGEVIDIPEEPKAEEKPVEKVTVKATVKPNKAQASKPKVDTTGKETAIESEYIDADDMPDFMKD